MSASAWVCTTGWFSTVDKLLLVLLLAVIAAGGLFGFEYLGQIVATFPR
jgi:hypothetical protein